MIFARHARAREKGISRPRFEAVLVERRRPSRLNLKAFAEALGKEFEMKHFHRGSLALLAALVLPLMLTAGCRIDADDDDLDRDVDVDIDRDRPDDDWDVDIDRDGGDRDVDIDVDRDY